MRTLKLLAAAFCICCCGCESVRDATLTGTLWQERDYVVPSPDPRLALFQTPQGILVQYDAECERNGDLHRRAYYLEPNLKRIAAGQKPIFINSATGGPKTAIPIRTVLAANEPPRELCAVCSTNFCTFTIYRPGQVLGPCDLPVFKDRAGTTTQAALTPLTVRARASRAA